MQNVVTFDVETTTKAKGSPFNQDNLLVMIQLKVNNEEPIVFSRENFKDALPILESASVVVGFNIKFDCHWLQRELGAKLKSVWDCQLCEFLLSNQQNKYPNLADTCVKYGASSKLDIIKGEYWNRSCSCHVSVVKQILNCMQKEFVSLVMIENINELNLVEHLKNAYGEKLIQKSMRLLNKGDVKNYLLVWKHRLEQKEQNTKTDMDYQILSMIDLWIKQYVLFVDQQTGWQLTTTTAQEKFGIVCVSLVTQLWDILKTQSGWEKHNTICKNTPIETTEIPWEILAEYGKQDVQSTYEVFLKQVELFEGDEQHKFKLFRLQCNDLLVLQEMEFNGIIYDEQGSLAESKNLDKQLKLLEDKISVFTNNIPINLDSRDHISVLLYGGTIVDEVRLPIGVYKSGAKIGQTRYKIIPREYELTRLVNPLKGSELKKEGYYGTDEPTLLSLKPNAQAKRLITWLLERSKIMKLKSTYLEGLPKIIRETGWMPNHLHSNLNQCTAKTGRLSSTKPNQQNLNPAAKQFCITRF